MKWLTILCAALLWAGGLCRLPAELAYSSASVWDFDSVNPVHPARTESEVAAAAVYAAITRANDFWNAHNLEGYLDSFWHSPALVVVEEGAVINGWSDFHDRSVRGFNEPEMMGRNSVTRVQIRMLTRDLALAVTHWTLAFPGSSHVVVGVDTTYIQSLNGTWKVITAHTSYMDM